MAAPAPEVAWARLTAPELRAIAGSGDALAVLPVGSLEQHGPHLPTITDTRTAFEISVRAARLAAPQAVAVMPGMWTGMSEHHLPFGGTISLTYDEFAGMLRGVARSCRALGFARLLIVNGHGGNDQPLSVACRELAVTFSMPIVVAMPWDVAADAVASQMQTARHVQHACEAETSVMLAIEPDLVRVDLLEEAVRKGPSPVAGQVSAQMGLSRFWSFAERAPVSGTRGDPRPATAAKGEAMLQAMAQALADVMTDSAIWRRPDLVWAPGRGLGDTADGAPGPLLNY